MTVPALLRDNELIPRSALAGLSMQFTKTNAENLRWAATASDTEDDLHGDNTTVELFSNFVTRAKVRGDFGYLSVAHYMDEAVPLELQSRLGQKARAGLVERLYIGEGGRLRAQGPFDKTPLGIEALKAIRTDHALNRPVDERVRLSIAFIDLKHEHKSNGFVFTRKALTDECPQCAAGDKGRKFLDGEFVHLALTRVPVNPRTPIEVEMSATTDAIKTQQDDAASIVGEDLAASLDEVAHQNAQTLSLVVRSEGQTGVTPEQAAAVIAEQLGALRQEMSAAVAPEIVTPPVEAAAVEPETVAADLSNAYAAVQRANSKAGLETALAQFSQVARSQLVVTDPVELFREAVKTYLEPTLNEFRADLAQIKSQQALQTRSAAPIIPGQPPVRQPLSLPVGQAQAQIAVPLTLQSQAAQNNAAVVSDNPSVTAGAVGGIGTPKPSTIDAWALRSTYVGTGLEAPNTL